MYENMKGMPEVMRRILPSAIRKEKDELMRERMVNLFGDIATEHEVAPLIHILEIDENTKVQQAAAEVLARLGDAAAAPPLLKKLSSAQPTERFYASRVLSSFPRPEVAAALFSHLENPQETPEVRHQAAQSLAAIIRMGFNDDDTFVQQLEQLLQDQAQPLSTKLLAALTLAALGHHSGYDLAMTNARSADTYLRGLAIIILGYIGDKEALPFLTDALQYGNKALRLQAAEALGRLGDAKALPSLYKALDDPSDAVREAAQKSINTIKAKGANG
jgi:HEAT repeat protein